MATMMDLDKDREVVKRTIKEKGPLTKAVEDFRSRQGRDVAPAIRRRCYFAYGRHGQHEETLILVLVVVPRLLVATRRLSRLLLRPAKSGKDQFTWNGKKYTTGVAKPKADSDSMKAHFHSVSGNQKKHGYESMFSSHYEATASRRAAV